MITARLIWQLQPLDTHNLAELQNDNRQDSLAYALLESLAASAPLMTSKPTQTPSRPSSAAEPAQPA
jgi:hypothetical protein